MPLEALLVCVDNSEWSRNGDFAPSRFESQRDASNLLASAKSSQNQESAVGVLTMAGQRSAQCKTNKTQSPTKALFEPRKFNRQPHTPATICPPANSTPPTLRTPRSAAARRPSTLSSISAAPIYTAGRLTLWGHPPRSHLQQLLG
eukprot:GHVT01102043.1.p1 GENE.GHVT01102043.1~~GHVT01102043.1.p1  ORF type:complete len:146 (+),score=24.60 GHVT01102043.1:475-912(+)